MIAATGTVSTGPSVRPVATVTRTFSPFSAAGSGLDGRTVTGTNGVPPDPLDDDDDDEEDDEEDEEELDEAEPPMFTTVPVGSVVVGAPRFATVPVARRPVTSS